MLAKLILWGNRRYINWTHRKRRNLLSDTMNRFERFLLIENGLGLVTVAGYMRCLRKFLREHEDIWPSQTEVIEYLSDYKLRGASYSHVRNLSRLFVWYFSFWGEEFQPAYARKPTVLPKETLSESEIRELIARANSLKERSLLSLIACSGIRTRELRNLRIRDLDLVNKQILVVAGKNKRDRLVCITDECVELLGQFTIGRDPNEYLFGDLNRRMSRKYLWQLFKRLSPDKRLYVHLFRHSLATNMLYRGASLLAVQRQLGHKNIETTMGYLAYTQAAFRKEYERTAPRLKIKEVN